MLSRSVRAVAGRCRSSVACVSLVLPRAGLAFFTSSSRLSSESHDDFKPKLKTSPTDPASTKARVTNIVKQNRVVLFMKGTPAQPMCGFSSRAVQVLHANGATVHGVDVLSDPTIRAFMKEFSQWQTFPQCYVDGEFVGGCDILTEMHSSGELKKLLAAAPKNEAPLA